MVYYIHAVAVKESQRGKGIGAKLLSYAIEQGKQLGSRGLHLDVLSDKPGGEFLPGNGTRMSGPNRCAGEVGKRCADGNAYGCRFQEVVVRTDPSGR